MHSSSSHNYAEIEPKCYINYDQRMINKPLDLLVLQATWSSGDACSSKENVLFIKGKRYEVQS